MEKRSSPPLRRTALDRKGSPATRTHVMKTKNPIARGLLVLGIAAQAILNGGCAGSVTCRARHRPLAIATAHERAAPKAPATLHHPPHHRAAASWLTPWVDWRLLTWSPTRPAAATWSPHEQPLYFGYYGTCWGHWPAGWTPCPEELGYGFTPVIPPQPHELLDAGVIAAPTPPKANAESAPSPSDRAPWRRVPGLPNQRPEEDLPPPPDDLPN